MCPGLMRELACAALRYQTDAGSAGADGSLSGAWLGDALLRPLLLCAVKCAWAAHACLCPAACLLRQANLEL